MAVLPLHLSAPPIAGVADGFELPTVVEPDRRVGLSIEGIAVHDGAVDPRVTHPLAVANLTDVLVIASVERAVNRHSRNPVRQTAARNDADLISGPVAVCRGGDEPEVVDVGLAPAGIRRRLSPGRARCVTVKVGPVRGRRRSVTDAGRFIL